MCGNNAPHADVFDDVRKGVSLDLITEMANTGTGLIDVHLLAEGALSAAFDVVCRPGVSGITFPYEGVDDVEAVARRIRAVGAQPWLAISPATQIERRRTSLCHVDGLLIMLIEPGSKQAADVAHLEKVAATHQQHSTGVDGGVTEAILDQILSAGTGYIVVGRRLFACSNERRNEDSTVNSLTLVQEEVCAVLRAVDPYSVSKLAYAFEDRTRRWFVSGQGRSRLVASVTAMRLMDVGFETHLVGEVTAPSIGSGDHLLMLSASGETPVSLHLARKAVEAGAQVLAVTTREDRFPLRDRRARRGRARHGQ